MKLNNLTPLICLSTLLGITSCQKESVDLGSQIQEGYLEIEMILNPSIHTYEESVSLNIEACRIGELSNTNLITSEPALFDASSQPSPVLLGTRAVLSPGGYANAEFDFSSSGQQSSYVVTARGNNDPLDAASGSTHNITANGNFLVENGTTTKRIMFIDMNKLVTTNKNGNVDFSFRENGTDQGAIRLLDPEEIGRINGTLTRSTETPRQTLRLVVYAYPLGQFNSADEVANGFSSAIVSANVRRNDQFTFPVLPEGAYELAVVEYQDENEDDILEFKDLLVADLDVNEITRLTRVSKNTETQVQVKLGGVVAD